MISLAEIKSQCTNDRTYARARALANSGAGAIRNRRISSNDEIPQSIILKSSVISSDYDCYDVEVTLENDTILEALCDCPAFEKYSGLCKHCAATLVAYRNQPDSFLDEEDEGVVYGRKATIQPEPKCDRQEADRVTISPSWLDEFLAAQGDLIQRGFPKADTSPSKTDRLANLKSQGAPSNRKDSKQQSKTHWQTTSTSQFSSPAVGQSSEQPETSPLLKQFIEQYAPATGFIDPAKTSDTNAYKRALSSFINEPKSNVFLEATITENEFGWLLSLRIGHRKAIYVVKEISYLLHCVLFQQWHSYGQKLSFDHNLTIFDQKSRAILGLLIRKYEACQEKQRGRFSLHNSPTAMWEKTVPLTDGETIELLGIHQRFSEPLYVQDPSFYGNGKQQVRVVREDPSLELELYQTKDGWLLDSGSRKQFVATGNQFFILQESTFYECSPQLAELAPLLMSLYRDNDPLLLSNEDGVKFAASLLPIFDERLTIHAPEEIRALKPVPCELEFYFDRDKKRVTCEVYAVYGSRRIALSGVRSTSQPEGVVNPESEEYDKLPMRDYSKESEATNLVEEYFATDMAEASKAGASIDEADVPFIPLSEETLIADLLFGGLARFKELGTAFTTDSFNRLLFERTPTINIGLSLTGDLIDLDVSSSDLSPDELAALLRSYKKRRSFHRLKSGAFLNLQEMNLHQFQQLDMLASDLGISTKQITSGHTEVALSRAFYLDSVLKDNKDSSFTQFLEHFHHLRKTAFAIPIALKDTLRPYQTEGFQWLSLLAASGFGGILADEMGLGKTLQIIAWLLSQKEALRKSDRSSNPESSSDARPAANPALIVCPASVVYNWVAELRRFAPELTVQALAGTKAERSTALKQPADVYIISYDSARLDIEDLRQISWFTLILDEAHYIKNQSSKTSQTLKRLQASHKFALTGTPMENRPSELYSLFEFIMPGYLGSYMSFRERFELDILGGDEEAVHRLHALVGPFILRRLKTDVLSELPDKLESIIRTPLTPEQHKLYDAEEQQIRTELALQIAENKQRRHRKNVGAREHNVEILAELTKLRQLCCDPSLVYENYTGGAAKVDAIMDIIDSAQDSGEKVLLFSQFTSFLSVLETRLMKEHIPYFILTGSTPKERRLELCNTFNSDTTPVFLISLKAGGVGLNLTGASIVIHADPWWNASAQNQATDRAHRIGQTRGVTVYKIIAAGTIEERILKLQEKKLSLADSLIGGESLSLTKLSDEELLELLSGAGSTGET